jgi:hypothetical protein
VPQELHGGLQARRLFFESRRNRILPQSLFIQIQETRAGTGHAEGGNMTALKKACLAAAVAAAAGISTGAFAQQYDPDYGGYSSRYYAVGPGYDEDVVIVRRAPEPVYYGYGYWTPSRDTACIQARRDFAERTNFICP